MPFVPVTAFYASLLAFILLYLAYQVVRQRLKNKVGLGHEKNKDLLIAGRNHANASEYIPISIILLGLAELNGVPAALLHACGLLLLGSRSLHAWGFKLSRGWTHPGRYWGTVGTWIVMFTLSLINLFYIWPFIFLSI